MSKKKAGAAKEPTAFEKEVGKVLLKFIDEIERIDQGREICGSARSILTRSANSLIGAKTAVPKPGEKYRLATGTYVIAKNHDDELIALNTKTMREQHWRQNDIIRLCTPDKKVR